MAVKTLTSVAVFQISSCTLLCDIIIVSQIIFMDVYLVSKMLKLLNVTWLFVFTRDYCSFLLFTWILLQNRLKIWTYLLIYIFLFIVGLNIYQHYCLKLLKISLFDVVTIFFIFSSVSKMNVNKEAFRWLQGLVNWCITFFNSGLVCSDSGEVIP